jgi:hypothetical protein
MKIQSLGGVYIDTYVPYNIVAKFHTQLTGTICQLSFFLQLKRPICLCFTAEAILAIYYIFSWKTRPYISLNQDYLLE